MSTPALPRHHDLRAGLFWLGFHLRRRLRTRAFRFWAAAVVLGVVFLAVVGRATTEDLGELLVLGLTPLMALFFGTGVLREEIEDQTLTYGFSRPVGRPWLYAARVLAAALPVALLAVPAAVWAGLRVGPQTALQLGVAALLATFAYSGFFALLGQLIRWPAWFGLAFLLFWDSLVGRVPGFLGRLTVSTYVRGITGLAPQDTAWSVLWEAPTPALSTVVLLGFTGATLWLGGQLVRRREYVLAK